MAKRIIDGKTYNTETATRIAAAEQYPEDRARFDELYQTRHGAYFRYHGDYSATDPTTGFLEVVEPLTPPEAQKWMERHASAGLIEKHFGEQPEAGEAESRVTVRIPDALKTGIEAVAAANKQSLNAWIMRCVEGCAMHQAESPPKPRVVRRGYKFTGPDADRNSYIYGLFRLGARIDLLASACGLTLPEAEQIVAEGNGGTLPSIYFDGNGDVARPPAPE
jgi:hypothetical protein